MATKKSLEDLLEDQQSKLDELQTATLFIQARKALKEELVQAKTEVSTIAGYVQDVKSDLEIMKADLVISRNLFALLEKLDARIVRMKENFPDDFLHHFTLLTQEASPFVSNSDRLRNELLDESGLVREGETLSVNTPEPRIEDCKKTLFKNAEDSYSMELLSPEEFGQIPKYMIGRQSLTALNDLVTIVNQILQKKYSVLSMGKDGARKKGKLDLYLSLKRDEIVVGPGEDPVYFFTAEDYNRHTQCKLDKTKLNLLTALRHCKRLRELRKGKIVQYVIIPAWEGARSGM